MKIERICILGGSGFVGTQLVSQLAARGLMVRVLSHRRETAKELILLPTVEVIEADVHDQQELIRHFRGMDAVINLVGILHESKVGRVDLPSARRGDFQKVHIELPRKVIHAWNSCSKSKFGTTASTLQPSVLKCSRDCVQMESMPDSSGRCLPRSPIQPIRLPFSSHSSGSLNFLGSSWRRVIGRRESNPA